MPPPGQPIVPQRKPRKWRIVVGVVVVLMLVVGLVDLHFSGRYDVFVPGEAPNAESHVTIDAPAADSAQCLPTTVCVHKRSGSIHLTTVGVYYSAPIFQLLQAKFNPRDAIYPENEYPNTPGAEIEAMDTSQRDGEVAALGQVLGYKNLTVDGALVVQVSEGTPAGKTLRPGDIIQSADGVSLATSTATTLLESVVGTHSIGQTVELSILRNKKPMDVSVGIIKNSQPPPPEIMGVDVEPDYIIPLKINIDSGDIGGPSAGLSWALSIVQMLGADDLTRGRTVADTGTIDYLGNVGDIGGIQQKVYGAQAIGATIFLCPKDQAADARAAAAKVGYHLKVVGVSTLNQAVQALKAS